MIRFLQASIAAPMLPVIWHPLLLLDHVTILSAVAYHWEQKRPPLTRKHWQTVLGGLAVLNLGVIALFGWRLGDKTLAGLLQGLNVNRSLIPVAITIPIFVAIAWWVRRKNPVASVAGYVSWAAAGVLFCLLPIAWWSVQLMRWWSKVYSLSQRPVFQRARSVE
jgi:hypothetical protein